MFRSRIIILIITIIAGYTISFSEDIRLPLLNSDFETIATDGFVTQWSIEGSDLKSGNHVTVDSKNVHSGKNSISITHNQWGRSTVVSQPLTLIVGELYRLSGWIKTSAVKTRSMDQYPTSVAACLTMESFPFTNHSPSLGATSDWQPIETLFIATASKDKVRLHLGFNGDAKGVAWFDQITLEKVDDISEYIPLETVQWCNHGYRYDDKGWIFVHIEGKPYQRGYQYGFLLANEIVAFMKKLAIDENEANPENAWGNFRQITHAFMINKYDEEYLVEMKGIADGAVRAGAEIYDRPVDFIDIVTINSHIDIDSAWGVLNRTPHPLSGRNFFAAEDEMNIPLKQHKCSGLLANGSATPNGNIVFGQIFMWSGYTGVHWNVICDVVPDKGNRLVYETFPGGIHSGADFYLNSSGIVIGETTVSQTPFNMDGIPQSNRIRKAAQYANNIDDVVKILSYKNNGMYTNDWLIADTKANETAIFLLGTEKSKLWRSSTGEFPGGTKDFYWSNNNNKDPEVRKEYIASPDNAPYNLVFNPWNRDVAFNQFYQTHKGNIDTNAVVNLWASTPINMSHACDGKITNTEMASHMVFLAHFGKVTLRAKFPEKGLRIMRDKEGATPHLSLGYSVVSPVFITKKLNALKEQHLAKKVIKNSSNDDSRYNTKTNKTNLKKSKSNYSKIKDHYTFNPRKLWFNTVYPNSNRENWFVSSTAAYWSFLKGLSIDTNDSDDKEIDSLEKAESFLTAQLGEFDVRLMYTLSREGTLIPLEAGLVYDQYKHYQVPLIRGTFLLHQLRLYLGNEQFSKIMNAVHDKYKEKSVTTKQVIGLWEKIAGIPLEDFSMQWLNRSDLPKINIDAQIRQDGDGWRLDLNVIQKGIPYHFITSLVIETGVEKIWETVEVKEINQSFSFFLKDKPLTLVFNAGNDIPVERENFYSFSNYYDDNHHSIYVYGTARQIEGNHTLALRFREVLANRFTEILPPVKKDSEVSSEELNTHDLIILGSESDNSLLKQITMKVGLYLGKNYFQWQGKTYGNVDDGLFVTFPNPYNSEKVVYLFIANSALQLYQMTKEYNKLPSWALFEGDRIVKKGFHPVKQFRISFPSS